MSAAQDTRYSVVCGNCGQVWQPTSRTPLWWQAKQKADAGSLDALIVSGEKCGCDKAPKKTGKPYEVFGYTDDLHDFRVGFDSFTKAAVCFRDADESGCVVFISGVSEPVEHRLRYGI